MKTFYTTDFTGHYPVGTSAIVRAESMEEAAFMLDAELFKQGLRFDGTFVELKGKNVIILNNGDY